MALRNVERLAKYFSVLQNALCLEILFLLNDRELFVYEITEKLKSKQDIISKCLKSLRLINLVGYTQSSRRRQYYLKRKDILALIVQFETATKRRSTG